MAEESNLTPNERKAVERALREFPHASGIIPNDWYGGLNIQERLQNNYLGGV